MSIYSKQYGLQKVGSTIYVDSFAYFASIFTITEIINAFYTCRFYM